MCIDLDHALRKMKSQKVGLDFGTCVETEDSDLVSNNQMDHLLNPFLKAMKQEE